MLYLGRIKAIQLDYTSANRYLLQAIRKAPQTSKTVGFLQAVSFHFIFYFIFYILYFILYFISYFFYYFLILHDIIYYYIFCLFGFCYKI